jgi:hypothetical protein
MIQNERAMQIAAERRAMETGAENRSLSKAIQRILAADYPPEVREQMIAALVRGEALPEIEDPYTVTEDEE